MILADILGKSVQIIFVSSVLMSVAAYPIPCTPAFAASSSEYPVTVLDFSITVFANTSRTGFESCNRPMAIDA